VPVHVVVEIEVPREAGAGELRLPPGAVLLPLLQEPETWADRGMAPPSRELEAHHPPRGLGGRADADSGERGLIIGVAGLTPAAIGVLGRGQPGESAVDALVVGVERRQRRDDAPGPVDVVDPPTAVPGAR